MSVEVRSRVEWREIRVEAVVAGQPDVARSGELPLVPERVSLVYALESGKWRVSATVVGFSASSQDPQRGVVSFELMPDETADGWPDWLVELADHQHPDRPGGWPGADPTGSYL